MKLNIYIHRDCIPCLKDAAHNTELFPRASRPVVHLHEYVILNETNAAIPCEGSRFHLERLQVFAKGVTIGYIRGKGKGQQQQELL